MFTQKVPDRLLAAGDLKFSTLVLLVFVFVSFRVFRGENSGLYL